MRIVYQHCESFSLTPSLQCQSVVTGIQLLFLFSYTGTLSSPQATITGAELRYITQEIQPLVRGGGREREREREDQVSNVLLIFCAPVFWFLLLLLFLHSSHFGDLHLLHPNLLPPGPDPQEHHHQHTHPPTRLPLSILHSQLSSKTS